METKQQSESQEQDRQPSIRLSSNNLQIVPFVPLETGWILSDEFLLGIFDKMDEQGLLKTVFWDGTVENGAEFIDFMKNDGNVLQFVIEDNDVVAMAWLGPISKNYAFAHFCTFSEIWGKKTMEAAELVQDFWFGFPGHNGPLLDTLIGVIPAFNTFAHKYVEKLGWTKLGVIPEMFRSVYNERDDAVIWYQTRKNHGR